MRREKWAIGTLVVGGNPKGLITVVEETELTGLVTQCKCATANIPSAVAGYAVGCLLTDTTTGKLYYNSGSATSCTFNSIADITAAEIGTAAIVSGHISAGQVVAAAIASNAVLTGHISAAQIVSGHISAGQVVAAAIASNTIVSGHISAGQVVAAAIATGAVVSGAISAGQVVAAAIASNAVLTGHISAAQVTNAKIKLSTVSLTFAANDTTVSTADQVALVGATVLGVRTNVSAGVATANYSLCGVVASAVVCTLTSGAAVSTVVDVVLALA